MEHILVRMNDDVKSIMFYLHYLWNRLTVSAMSLEHMCSTFVIYEKFGKFLVFHDTHALLKMKLKNWEFPKNLIFDHRQRQDTYFLIYLGLCSLFIDTFCQEIF